MSSLHAWGYQAILFFAVFLRPALASAAGIAPEEKRQDPEAACIAEHDLARAAMRADKLIEARGALLVCAKEVCAKDIRADCATQLDAVTAVIPSVIVRARTRDREEERVLVTIDGIFVPMRRDGRPIELNPGMHNFRFEAPLQEPVDQPIAIVRGEKYRIVSVRFERPATAPVEPLEPKPVPAAPPPAPVPVAVSAPAPVPTPSPLPPAGDETRPAAPFPETHRPIPVLAYVLAGGAVASMAIFAGFALSGVDERQSLSSQCAPHCSDEQIGSVRTKLATADVALSVSVLSLAGAAYVYIARPAVPLNTPERSGAQAAPKDHPTLDVTWCASGAVVSLRGAL